MKKIFTTGEVAKIMTVAPRTVSKLIDCGKLRGYRIPRHDSKGGDRRIPRENLIRFLKDNNMPLGDLETEQWHKLLLIGADKLFITLLTDVLPECDRFKCEFAQSGFEAGILAESFRPESIVIDMVLGRTESIQIMRNLRKYPAYEKTLIIGLANEDEVESEKLVEDGFSLIFKKPVDQLAISIPIIEHRNQLDGIVPEYGKGQAKRIRTRKPATLVASAEQ